MAGVSCHQRKTELWGISLEGELPVRAKAQMEEQGFRLNGFYLPFLHSQDKSPSMFNLQEVFPHLYLGKHPGDMVERGHCVC